MSDSTVRPSEPVVKRERMAALQKDIATFKLAIELAKSNREQLYNSIVEIDNDIAEFELRCNAKEDELAELKRGKHLRSKPKPTFLGES